METQDGFTAHLMAIGGSNDLNAQTRWLAVVYLKNQVARFWLRRTGVPYEIGAHEKSAIRNGCLPLSLDADEKIASQSALVVSRIVRFDYPRVWPDIMPMIAQAVEQNMPSRPLGNNASGVQVTRVLHYCLKELSTKRLVQDRKAFFQVAPAFLSLMLQFWSIHHDALSPYLAQACAAYQQGVAPPASVPEGHLLGFILATKVLRRILVMGFPRLHAQESALPIVSTLAGAWENYHAVYALSLPHPARTIAARSTYFLGKLVAEVMENHTLALRADLQKLLNLVHGHLQLPAPSSDDSTGRGLRVTVLRTLHGAIRQGAFAVRPIRGLAAPDAGAEGDGGGGSSAHAEALVAAFVSGERVADLCSGIVLGALKADADDAEDLLGEGLEAMQAGDAEEEYQNALASVAAACLACLMERAGEGALATLLQLQRQGVDANASEAQREDGAMVREACYHALGAVAAHLIGLRGPGVALLAAELVQGEAATTGGGGAGELALKRAVWLLGRLVSADLEVAGGAQGTEVSRQLVPMLCQLLSAHPSLAVRVSAASSLACHAELAADERSAESLRLPAGDVRTVCAELAQAAASLAMMARFSLDQGLPQRQGEEGLEMAVNLLSSIALRLRSLDGGEGQAVPGVVLPHVSTVWHAAGNLRRLQVSVYASASVCVSVAALSLVGRVGPRGRRGRDGWPVVFQAPNPHSRARTRTNATTPAGFTGAWTYQHRSRSFEWWPTCSHRRCSSRAPRLSLSSLPPLSQTRCPPVSLLPPFLFSLL